MRRLSLIHSVEIQSKFIYYFYFVYFLVIIISYFLFAIVVFFMYGRTPMPTIKSSPSSKGYLRLQRRYSNGKRLSRGQGMLKVHRERVPTLDSPELHDVILGITFAQLEVLHAGHLDTPTEI